MLTGEQGNRDGKTLTSRSFLEEEELMDEAFLWPCRSLYTELCPTAETQNTNVSTTQTTETMA